MIRRVVLFRGGMEMPRIRSKGGVSVLSVDSEPWFLPALPTRYNYLYPTDVRISEGFPMGFADDWEETKEGCRQSLLDLQSRLVQHMEMAMDLFEARFKRDPEAIVMNVGNEHEVSFSRESGTAVRVEVSTVFALAALEDASAYKSLFRDQFPFESLVDPNMDTFPDLGGEKFTLENASPLILWYMDEARRVLWRSQPRTDPTNGVNFPVCGVEGR